MTVVSHLVILHDYLAFIFYICNIYVSIKLEEYMNVKVKIEGKIDDQVFYIGACWSSSSMFDCRMRGPWFESYIGLT